METRTERYKRIRKEKYLRRFKFITIIIIICSMSYGLYIVNDTIRDFDMIDNDYLIELDINNNRVNLLGKSYYIDFQVIKNVFKQ
ncbi:MAG: hypothetical protein GX053_09345 [Tissierella sp.]|nr:hypothetical protein [Tissierella sp.]